MKVLNGLFSIICYHFSIIFLLKNSPQSITKYHFNPYF